MWSDLPFDLLAYLFSSFLSLDSLACAGSTCRQWHTCFKACILSSTLLSPHQPAWFIALPARNHSLCCYLHNPIRNHWHSLSLDFLPCPVRLVASIGSHLLFKATNPKNLQLLICNPFTRQYKQLPTLHKSRSNPAVAVVTQDSTRNDPSPCFNIYVAGGTSEAMRGYVSNYNHNLEVYDSKLDAWRFIGPVPMEFTVRLTVWTPTDSAFSNGVIYWITSARAYSLMGYDISSNTWRELKVPVPNKLEFAATVLRHGKLSLVGGMCGGRGEASIWELREGDTWELIEKVPEQLGLKFVGENESWVGAKCVCNDGAYYLYKDLESGMIVWKEVGDKGKWEWFWVDGYASIGENQVPNLLIKGVLATPNLAPSSSLF